MNKLSALALLLFSNVLSSCQAEPPAKPSEMGAGGSNSPGAGADEPRAVSGSASGGSASGGSASGGSASGGTTSTAGVGAGAAAGGGGGLLAGAGASGSAAGGSGGGPELPPLEECAGKPSVDRLTEWIASGEGTTVPATGSILAKMGERYVGKVELVGAGWHVIPVYIKNKFGESLDLSTATGITLTYSATAELHVQLRSKSHWSGGNQYATTIPSTNGEKQTKFFSFSAGNWQSLFGAPTLSYADTLKEGMGLVFVGDGANSVVFYGLRIDGYTPPCP